jgi:hypothetical protein
MPVQRLDDTRRPRAIPERVADQADTAFHGRLTHGGLGPQVVKQLLFAEDPVAMLHEIGQHFEYLRLEGHDLAFAAQLVAVRVERVRPKDIAHGILLVSGGRGPTPGPPPPLAVYDGVQGEPPQVPTEPGIARL